MDDRTTTDFARSKRFETKPAETKPVEPTLKPPPSEAPPKRKSKAGRRFGLFILLAGAATAAWWYYGRQQQPQQQQQQAQAPGRGGRFSANAPMPVVVAPAVVGDIDITLNALGTVTSLATVTMKSLSSANSGL